MQMKEFGPRGRSWRTPGIRHCYQNAFLHVTCENNSTEKKVNRIIRQQQPT